MDDKARKIALTALADSEKFIPSKEGLDSHHKAANSFWGKAGAKQEITGVPHCEQYFCHADNNCRCTCRFCTKEN